jgi:hypothetical protein
MAARANMAKTRKINMGTNNITRGVLASGINTVIPMTPTSMGTPMTPINMETNGNPY